MAQKIKETVVTPAQGMSEAVHILTRVRELGAGETLANPLPPTMTLLPDNDLTPLSDWHKEGETN